ncbi:MAG: DUF3418 domain-containing protein, partial [Gammaproteobacteria bacterium]|nr:DUF3418 domain-containing protein [Gammaproteobacteria bacterium]
LVPLPDTARECLEGISGQPGPLLDCLGEFLQRRYGIEVSGHNWDEEKIPQHLRMNIRVINDDGQCIARGRDLDSLRKELSEQASEVFTVPDAHPVNRSGLTDWNFSDLPEQVEIEINGSCLTGYPALIDETDSVAIRTLDTRAQAEYESIQGLRRLLMFRLAKDLKYLRKHLPHIEQIRMLYSGIGSGDALMEDLIRLILDRVFIEDHPLPRERQAFEALIENGIVNLVSEGNRVTELVYGIMCQYRDIRSALADMHDRAVAEVTGDINGQLESLVFDGFLGETPVKWLQHYPRYLSAIERRIEKLEYSAAGELQRIREVQQFEKIYAGFVPAGKATESIHPEVEHLRWMIQEYRVSLFAQELKTHIPVSAKRLEKQIEKIRQS